MLAAPEFWKGVVRLASVDDRHAYRQNNDRRVRNGKDKHLTNLN